MIGLYKFRKKCSTICGYIIRKTKLYHLIKHRAVKKDFLELVKQNDIDSDSEIVYSKIWNTKFEAYKKIIIGKFFMRRIGEMCFGYYFFLGEKETDVAYVMIPITFQNSFESIPNNALFEIMKKDIEFISPENKAFWKWAYIHKRDRIRFTDMLEPILLTDNSMDYTYNKDVPSFSTQQIIRCEEKKTEIGIRGDYICVFARDEAYYNLSNIDDPPNDRKARNSNIENMYLSANQLKKEGIQTVRVGSVVSRKSKCDSIIDYPTLCRTELMDLFLISKSKFFVASGSGIMMIATLFSVPLLLHDVSVISFGGDMVTPLLPERDMLLMKKIWNKHENRYLSLKEILSMEGIYRGYNLFDEYEKAGCIFIDNSPEEIWDAIEEMNQRVDGRREYSETERLAQSKYLEIVKEYSKKNHLLYYNGRYSTSFLVNNPWFIS